MDRAMDELNELIGCFEEELRDIRSDKEMSLSQKVISLRNMLNHTQPRTGRPIYISRR